VDLYLWDIHVSVSPIYLIVGLVVGLAVLGLVAQRLFHN
jgi:hypothetical protein